MLDEAVVVARIGVQERIRRGDERGVRQLTRIVEHAFGAGQPAKIRLIANDDGVVAALVHELANTLDATERARSM